MGKCKLTGEYQFTDNGVEIEGRITDTHIPELRDKFAEIRGASEAYLTVLTIGDEKDVPVADRTSQYRMLGPRWFNKMKNKGLITNDEINTVLGQKTINGSNHIEYEFQRAGVLYQPGHGLMWMRPLLLRDTEYRRHMIQSKMMNCGWVFDKVQTDGSFKVQLYGLVNRHILTMILGKATNYAKLLDSDFVQKMTSTKANLMGTASPHYDGIDEY